MTIQFLALVVTIWLMGLNVHAQAQPFDLLIKGGRVIDPRNQVDSVLDVAIAGGKIARVAADIAADQARQVVDPSRTRILAFLNIVGSGMRGDPVEQSLADMDSKLTAMRVQQFPQILVGVKVAHYRGPEWDPV